MALSSITTLGVTATPASNFAASGAIVIVAHFPPLFVVEIGNPVIIVQTGWTLDGGQVDGFNGIFDTTGQSSVIVNIHLTQPRVGIALTNQGNSLEGF